MFSRAKFTREIIFRSTRLSRASTHLGSGELRRIRNFDPRGSREPRQDQKSPSYLLCAISIHEALASLDYSCLHGYVFPGKFRSTRLSRASTGGIGCSERYTRFRSTRLSRASTQQYDRYGDALYFDPRGSREPRQRRMDNHYPAEYFDPRGSREPRRKGSPEGMYTGKNFDPRGSREPRPKSYLYDARQLEISIHEALASLDNPDKLAGDIRFISIHEALASLDIISRTTPYHIIHFDPRGSREPRRHKYICAGREKHFDPRGSREPRQRCPG